MPSKYCISRGIRRVILVFYCAEADLLVAGDVIFYESVGRTDFERSNHDDLIRNIREKIFTLPEDTQIVTGHGRMTTVGYENSITPIFKLQCARFGPSFRTSFQTAGRLKHLNAKT